MAGVGIALFGVCGASPAAAAPLIASPGAGAVLTHSPVRVEVRAASTNRTRVLLGDRDVTSRLRATRGRLVGKLSPRNGVRYGRNTLVVVEGRGGNRIVKEARSFHLLRRNNGLVRMTLRRGARLRAEIRIGSRVQGLGRERKVTVSLNGRSVTRAIVYPLGARHTLKLSATHGVRFGVNRLRVRVSEPRRGRYALITRRFVVRRNGPLAGAGWDRAALRGERVRLGGDAKPAGRKGRLRYRWVLVKRPRGSRARLSNRRAKRPLLVPDRRGRYLVRQIVTEHRRTRASAAQVGNTGVDEVETVTGPSSVLQPVSVNVFPFLPRRIQIGDVPYDHPGPGATIQWLTLDRASLVPTGTGNTACCEGQNTQSLDTLKDALSKPRPDQLVIIAIPPGRVTLPQSQYDEFNEALALIGVNPLSDAALGAPGQQISIIGVPGAPLGTGWVWSRGSRQDKLPTQGWLMPDGTQKDTSQQLLFRFQPLRMEFDTQSLSTPSPTANTMTFAGVTTPVASIPAGTGGFHVVEIDPRDLTWGEGGIKTFVTNGTDAAGDNLDAMAAFLDGIRANGNYVAVQSIGNVGYRDREWGAVSASLAKFGANPHGFNFLDPAKAGSHYAFFGGPPLTRNEVAQSSSNLLVGTTGQQFQPGSLAGRARMRRDGLFAPSFDNATVVGGSIYDIVFGPSAPWPYTKGDPNTPASEVPAYAAAMAYITKSLPEFKSYGTDLRTSYLKRAYIGSTDTSYSDGKTDLAGLAYPGDGRSCTAGKGTITSDPGYNRKQYCNLVKQLQIEFDWIDGTRTFFDSYEEAADRSKNQSAADLVTVGEKIRASVDPPDTAIVSAFLFLLGDIADFGEAEGAPFGLFASLFDVGSDVASDASGTPIDDQISTTVDDLSAEVAGNVAKVADSLDSVRAVAISDYGRLSRLGPLALAQNTSVKDVADKLTQGSRRYFISTLMRVGYLPWELEPVEPQYVTIPMPPAQCAEDGDPQGLTWSKTPDSAWIAFRSGPDTSNSNDWQTLVLNDGKVLGGYVPPDTLTGPMFTPVSESVGNVGGYGLEKSTWFWQLGDPYRTDQCYPLG